MKPPPMDMNNTPKPRPSVVVFDLGKVLLEFDYSIASRRVSENGTATPEQVRAALLETPLLYRFETGALTPGEFHSELASATGYRGTYAQFLDAFADIFAPIHEMIDLHASLRRRGVPTFIFSNTNGIAINFIRDRFPFFANFDDYVLSYEHGSMKPEPKLYEVVERVTRSRGSDILYIDDRPENIEAGAGRGWQVILQESPGRTREQVLAHGLLG